MRVKLLGLFARLALALMAVATLNAQVPRIVAIGDIHGALEPFVGILRAAGLIDAQRQWIGGTATLVQTYCGNGTHIQEKTYEGVTHDLIGYSSAGDVASFFAEVLAGGTPPSGC